MNQQERAASTALTTQQTNYEVAQVTDAASLILGPGFERVQSFAALMSKGAVSVPQHFRGNMGDCMAITIQALGWKMNPFAVAQKTHMSQSGALGYEAQLVSAVLVSSGAINGEPDYEPIGDWSKVLGKVEERKSDKGGKYYAATYTKEDEKGLGVIVIATLRGDSKPRRLPVMMSQAYPRFSTQWATDPYQQLCYLAVRKWGRLHSPGAILGVYTPDELDGSEVAAGSGPGMKTIDPDTGEIKPPIPPTWPDETFEKQLPKLLEAIAKGKSVADAIAWCETKGRLTDAQKAKLRPVKTEATDATPKVTCAHVTDKLRAATNEDELNEAAALIAAIADDAQRNEANAFYDTCLEKLRVTQ